MSTEMQGPVVPRTKERRPDATETSEAGFEHSATLGRPEPLFRRRIRALLQGHSLLEGPSLTGGAGRRIDTLVRLKRGEVDAHDAHEDAYLVYLGSHRSSGERQEVSTSNCRVQGGVGYFEKQALLWVHRVCLGRGDSEDEMVKALATSQEGAVGLGRS